MHVSGVAVFPQNRAALVSSYHYGFPMLFQESILIQANKNHIIF